MNRLKLHRNFLNLFFVAILSVSSEISDCQPVINYGLRFASYEVSKDLRTSLNLCPEKPLRTRDKFTLKFDFRYYRYTNTYGYIFRIVSDNSKSFDLVSKTSFEQDYDLKFVAEAADTKIHFDLDEILPESTDNWINAAITFNKETNVISLTMNDITRSDTIDISEISSLSVMFGANSNSRFSTSDVPPIVIKDVKIFTGEKEIAFWKLDQHADIPARDLIKGKEASVLNPVWEIDSHSNWEPRFSLRTSQYPQIAFNRKKGEVYIVEGDKLNIYYLSGDSVRSTAYRMGRPLGSMSNQLIYNEYRDELWQYVINVPVISRYSFSTNSWNTNQKSISEPNFWHHNKLFSCTDSSLLTFGGYGFYTYKNVLNIYSEAGGKWETPKVEGFIRPRYLAAMGYSADPERILIFGGYGNESGKQEHSPESLYDLYSLDLKNFEFTKLWELSGVRDNFVVGNSLIVDSLNNCFYVLCYPPHKYSSSLFLAKFPVSGPEMIIISDSIPYSFQDTESYADLFLSERTGELIAVTSSFVEDNQSEISIYSMEYPPVSPDEKMHTQVKSGMNLTGKLTMLFILLTSLSLTGYILKRRKGFGPGQGKKMNNDIKPANKNVRELREIIDAARESSVNPDYCKIRFLGGFQVFDQDGKNISGQFTPTLRRLFVMISLSTVNMGKGVSSVFLKDNFWIEKSKENARNIRGVYLSKLRMILRKIGNVRLDNNNDYWQLSIDKAICFDYAQALELMGIIRGRDDLIPELYKELLIIGSKGTLLPEMEYDWLDKFKSDYANNIIDTMLMISNHPEIRDNVETVLQIADIIFINDALNEDALRLKCRLLNDNGKHSLAKKIYESFAKEYSLSLGTPFQRSFNDLVSNSH